MILEREIGREGRMEAGGRERLKESGRERARGNRKLPKVRTWGGSFSPGRCFICRRTQPEGVLCSSDHHHPVKKKIRPQLVWLSGLSAGCETKGRRFDSQSGHVPGLRARSPVWAT